MKLSEEKKFAIIFIIIFILLNSYFLHKNIIIPVYFFTSLIIIFTFSIFFNQSLLKYLMKKWMKFALLISKVMNPIFMLIIYIFTVVPIGLIMKLFRVDSLKLKKNNKKTYWQKRENNLPNDMNDQF